MGRVALLMAGALSMAAPALAARADQPGANAHVVVSSPSGDPVVVAPAPLGAAAAADSDSVFAKGPAFTVGVLGGFGAPEGYGGAALGFEPNRWLSFELGGGSGGSFGPAAAETVRVGIPVGPSQRIGVGVGASQNFLIKNPELANAPPVAYFLNPEMFDDIRSKIGLGIRFSAGIGVLLNGASYRNLCEVPAPSASSAPGAAETEPSACPAPSPFMHTPLSAAENADQGRVTFFPYGRIELSWAFSV
jgi:hypothetical protein